MGMPFRPFPFILGILAMLVAGSLYPARAVPFIKSEPANLFGNLTSTGTACSAPEDDGPVSAINSFVFLQNKYPKVYGSKLIGNVGSPPTEKELIAAANNLARNFIMNCQPAFDLQAPIGDFILGKRDYINMISGGTLKGSTTILAQTSQPWREVHELHPKAKKPGLVSANTKPTWWFLYSQIKAGEDVEIDLGPVGSNAYLTLTGISFDPKTKKGSLKVIDPGGVVSTLTLEQLANGYLKTNYGTNGDPIIGAVAESPKNKVGAVPEPASLALLLIGCVGLLAARRPGRRAGADPGGCQF